MNNISFKEFQGKERRIPSFVEFHSSHVVEGIDITVIASKILLFNEPFELFLDHLLRGQEHVLQNLNKFSLKEDKVE